MSTDTQNLMLNFLDVFNNTEDAAIFPLYAEDLVWKEMPSGRVGGREQFYQALRDARKEVANLHLEAVSITAGDDNGVL